jgi:CBS domain-containing protein
MKVKNVMIALDKFPVISENLFFKEAIDEMSFKKIGIACIIDKNFHLKGILTDGDIRRKLLKAQKPLSALFIDDCIDHAIVNPIVTSPEESLKEAINIMELHQVWDLPVVDEQGKLIGLLHLHPAVQALLNGISV